MAQVRVGEMLLKANLITPEQLDQALAKQKTTGGRIGVVLAKLGYIDEDEIASCLGRQYGVPSVDLNTIKIDPLVLNLISGEVARKHQIVPLSWSGSSLTVAMADPSDFGAIDELRFITGHNIQPMVAPKATIQNTLNRYYNSAEVAQGLVKDFQQTELVSDEPNRGETNLAELYRSTEDAPVVKLVNLILTDAINKGASDIHMEPYEKAFRIRFRLDGILYEVMSPPTTLHAAVISRIKIMAQLDIAERRIPQDGRIKVKMQKRELDLRISTVPTLFGEKVVMRLLDRASIELDMSKLGLEPEELVRLEKAILAPHGMILVTGPTGSGKTTTLYSVLNRLNSLGTNIMTAEDPIEYNLTGINQAQVKPDIGLTFASLLRSFLRQDPDIIMVGEIRDAETAEIAIKAALTGHLVLSTVHTNDAISTVGRLISMGVPAYLVSASLNLLLAQRLVRRLCAECRTEVKVPVSTLTDIGFSPQEAKTLTCYQGKGCNACRDTGYRGRIGLYEVVLLNEQIREAILNGASISELRLLQAKYGMRRLEESGLQKIREGVTTVAEVVRVTSFF
ncbi:type II secretion system protein GspE [Candidatus Methylomirabilis limnetica]|jgi:type IV pilus assembly protein PilB|uniref:protein-secreting ATPase n=1 Tax=Candidatus Methylomirabilis limnetica TaxID=2033718 RepID=A0A2T4TVF3_9BACT|nr:type IV-A pilus assembly ATPase PilB [Candidatus Methylomirabilis limnetica]PTL35100.1 type II secretion system protein GspE [Candidatus Methylomirabilis limnetica]